MKYLINKAGFIFFLLCLFLIPNVSTYLDKSFSLKKKRILYVPDEDIVKFISGSFQNFIADIFYIKGVQLVTEDFEDWMEKVKFTQANFGLALSLDPALRQSYFFGGMVIAFDDASRKECIEFLEKYKHLNPSEWKVPYLIGFNYYELGDYFKAVEYFEKASLLPNAPAFLKRVQAGFYYKGGRSDLGVFYLEGLYESTTDKDQLEWIEKKLKWLKNIIFLEKQVEKFKKKYGTVPNDLEQLVEYKFISAIPESPLGEGYYLDKKTGRVKTKIGFKR